jgi:hypothetical protein
MSRHPVRRSSIDRLASHIARRLLGWSSKHVHENEQAWLDALSAELEEIESGGAQLLWAMGGLRLVGVGRWRAMSSAYRFSPIVLVASGTALFTWLAWILAQEYLALALVLGVLTGIGLLVTVPLFALLTWAVVKVARWRLAAREGALPHMRRTWSSTMVVAGILCLIALLGFGWTLKTTVDQMLAQGPATAGIVASAADHDAVEAALSATPGMAAPDRYLTTLVKPLAVNGVPLAQLAGQVNICDHKTPPSGCPTPAEKQLAQVAQGITDKFTGLQGFDLAHGQLPRISGFERGAGATDPGPDEMIDPWGRQLDASDANTYNVLVSANQIPLCLQEYCGNYTSTNGDVISAQSLVTGQILNLRIVGQYYMEDGNSTPLFGKVLADDGLVQALSGGAPSYAYGLRVDTNQRQALFARISAAAPAAQLYDFTSISDGARTAPGYTSFTDANTEEIYFAWEQPQLTMQAALTATLLGAIIIVATLEIWGLARARRTVTSALAA